MNEHERYQTLADFLRTRRARLSPTHLGLPQGGRRRTPGLRREEVAQAAGMSTTWYTWLEQGRAIQVSTQVIESLARILQLNTDERAYLFQLALPPSMDASVFRETVSPTLLRVVEQMGANPAYIRGQRWDILTWNRAACVVLGDFCQLPVRNSLYRFFCLPEVKQLYPDWENIARRMLAQFRVSAGARVEDPWFKELIATISKTSPEFRAWWPHHEVLGTPEGSKELRHPLVGRLFFEHTTFLTADAPTLQLVLYMPLPEADTANKLQHLLASECTHHCSRSQLSISSTIDGSV